MSDEKIYRNTTETPDECVACPGRTDGRTTREMFPVEGLDDPERIYKRTYLLLKNYMSDGELPQELSHKVREWLVDPANGEIKDRALQTIFMETCFSCDAEAGEIPARGAAETFYEQFKQSIIE